MAIKTFTTGEVLTAADTNTYLANSGLVFVKSQTVGTAQNSVTVSDAFSATYDAYRIIYTGGTATSTGNIRFAFNGSPAGWYGNILFADFLGGSPASIGASNLTIATFIGGAPGLCPQVMADIQNPFLTKPSFASANYLDGSNAGRSQYYHSASTSYTGFILSANTGETFTGGTITVYGYRKP